MNNRVCRHCKHEFNIADKPKGWMANHVRWCSENPKRSSYGNGGVQLNTPQAIEKRKKKISQAHKNGKYDDAPQKAIETKRKRGNLTHTEKSIQLIREKALSSKHRRLKRGIIEYKGIMLDSSWELELAKRLDDLKIKWVRPDPIPWIDDNGVTHNYFPDFYLEDYDLFLDPKNPQARKVQKKKLECLLSQYDNVVIIESIEECKKFVL